MEYLQLQHTHTHIHKLVCMYYHNTMCSWVGAKSVHGLFDIGTFGDNGGMFTLSWSLQVYVNVSAFMRVCAPNAGCVDNQCLFPS